MLKGLLPFVLAEFFAGASEMNSRDAAEELQEQIHAIKMSAAKKMADIQDGRYSPTSLLETAADGAAGAADVLDDQTGLPPLHVNLDSTEEAEYTDEKGVEQLMQEIPQQRAASSKALEAVVAEVEAMGKRHLAKPSFSLVQTPETNDFESLKSAKQLQKVLGTAKGADIPALTIPTSLLQTSPDDAHPEIDTKELLDSLQSLNREELEFNQHRQAASKQEHQEAWHFKVPAASLLEKPRRHHKHESKLTKEIEASEAALHRDLTKVHNKAAADLRHVMSFASGVAMPTAPRDGEWKGESESLLQEPAPQMVDEDKASRVFAGLDDQMRRIGQQTEATLQLLKSKAAIPTSFAETETYTPGKDLQGLDAEYAALDQALDSAEGLKKDRQSAPPSSLVERGAAVTEIVATAFANLDEKLKQHQAWEKARQKEDVKAAADALGETPQASSFVQSHLSRLGRVAARAKKLSEPFSTDEQEARMESQFAAQFKQGFAGGFAKARTAELGSRSEHSRRYLAGDDEFNLREQD